MLVHQIIQARAAHAPASPALRFDGATITYAELEDWAESFANVILDEGGGPGSLVGVMASRSPESVACFLGILKAGATYVPIAAEYPAERVRLILSELGENLACLFYRDVEPEGLTDSRIVATGEVARSTPRPRVLPTIDADAIAYIVYTSGSTGVPKGVMIRHRSIAAVVPELIAAYAIRPHDRVLHCAPLGFDTSISEMLRALCAGACLCIAPFEVTASPSFFYRLELLAEERMTRAVLPAALLRAAKPVPLPDLEVLATTGEACTAELVDRWAPGRTLLNAWGSTEGTFATTIKRCIAGRDERPPVGRPISTAEVFVVDDDNQSLPPGEIGQIHIAGAGVAAGYYKRPELTAERFVPNRWGSTSDTAFATGDLGRVLANGDLDCLGRIDDQVKVSGYRVDLAEVETALRRCTRVAVRDVAVVAVGTALGGTALVANVVVDSLDGNGDGSRQDAIAAIGADVAQVLPAYALPREIRIWDALPLTVHGKIDRIRLGTA